MTTAAEAQTFRNEILSRVNVETVHGPLMQTRDTYYLRYITKDGDSYSLELRKESGTTND